MNFSQKLVHLLQERFLLQVSPLKVFWKKAGTTLPERYLTINELKDAFFSLKMEKSTGADKISFNVIKNGFGELIDTLRYDFDLSFQTGIFSDLLNIAKVSPVFKTDDLNEISNYHSISVLPCFSKKLERIMYNRLYSYLVRSYLDLFEAVWVPKRSFHRTCHCSIG